MARGQKPEKGDLSQNEGDKVKASAQDLIVGANWLRSALEGYNEGEFDDIQASVELCIAYLDAEIERREARSELAARKRAYAVEHGLKVSQVRVSKKVA
jgi:hypothetical protein